MNGESAMSRDEDTKEFERKRELHKILIKQGRINEKKRIIAKLRAKAEAAPYASERDFYLEFANELEAEDG